MNTLQNNDFMILSNIIYKIHTNVQFTQMQKSLLEQLKMLIDFDSADFSLAKGDGSTNLVSEVNYNIKENFSKQYENLDYSSGILFGGKSMVYRETDIISDEERVKTDYYKRVYKPNDWHYSLQLILAYNEKFLGVVTLYRLKAKSDFKYTDIFLLEILKEHLSYRLFDEVLKANKQGDKLSVDAAVKNYMLTNREGDVLKLIMQGVDNKEICDELVISNNTLKKHILNVYKKIGVSSRVQLFKMIQD